MGSEPEGQIFRNRDGLPPFRKRPIADVTDVLAASTIGLTQNLFLRSVQKFGDTRREISVLYGDGFAALIK